MILQRATPELMEAIKKAIEDVEFGKITIQLNHTRDSVDLMVEERARFPVKRRGKVLECK